MPRLIDVSYQCLTSIKRVVDVGKQGPIRLPGILILILGAYKFAGRFPDSYEHFRKRRFAIDQITFARFSVSTIRIAPLEHHVRLI